MLRNWTGPVLVAAQISITLAVLINAVYIVKQRVDRIGRPTGIDVENIFVIRSVGVNDKYAHEAAMRADLAYLRGVTGVVAAAPISSPPLTGRGDRIGVMLKFDDHAHGIVTHYYEVDDQALAALGVRLAAGRFFQANEVLPPRRTSGDVIGAPVAVITQALANDLYPDGHALGKPIYDSFGFLTAPATIVGIIEHMHGSRVSWDKFDRILMAPRLPFPDEPAVNYLVRTRPGQRDVVLRAVDEHMQNSNPDRMIEWTRTLEYLKNLSYVADRNMAIFLVAITLMLIAITCIGIYGLATFNVSRRARQIGTRRALGAQREDIVRYFLVENWLITTVGVIIGCALALVSGYWLSTHYGFRRRDPDALDRRATGRMAARAPCRRGVTGSGDTQRLRAVPPSTEGFVTLNLPKQQQG
jgi:putative ABC transport system permease protein